MLEGYEARRVDGRIPATFEIVTAHAWGQREGQRPRLPMGGPSAATYARALRDKD
jgi:malonyl-CoA O-methyltransferase